jgi:hypothetical protein
MFSVKHQKQLELLRFWGICSRSDGVHGPATRYAFMLRRTLLSALVMLAAVAAAEPAFAQRHDRDRERGSERFEQRDPRSSWDGPQQQREVPLSSIVRDIGRQYGGRLLDSSRRGDTWVIGWITQDGRRLTIEADSASGRILSTRG